MVKHADNIFTYCMGIFLIVATQVNFVVPTFAHGVIATLVIIAALVSIGWFGLHGAFWTGVLQDLDNYGPNGPQHEDALKRFDDTSNSTAYYSNPFIFFLSFGGSLTLMAGLFLQGWYFTLGLEILGSAIGYGFIHYFQVNRMNILGQITGADEAVE